MWATVTAIITFGWIAINWFYIMPKIVKKQQGALNDIIAKLEAVNDYYNEKKEQMNDQFKTKKDMILKTMPLNIYDLRLRTKDSRLNNGNIPV